MEFRPELKEATSGSTLRGRMGGREAAMMREAKPMTVRLSEFVVFVSMTLLLTACAPDETNKPVAVPYSSNKATLIEYVYHNFEPARPGFGLADYPGYGTVHIPKSYAKILLAEVERRRHGLRPDLPDMGTVAGRWLLDNADVNGDGVIGWGVPIAWDAYGDGTVNPANTEYTISTAIVVDALLTWMEANPSAPGEEIVRVVGQALRPYTDPNMRSPSGMAPYSFLEWDRAYDTFNPAAYLAGQLQRFSRITADVAFARRLAAVADATAQALLDHKRINPETGSWFWDYSIQQNVANDLAHASYIVDGILKYAAFGGTHASRFDLQAIVSHLREFTSKDYIRGWPRLEGNIDRPARTYDIGMAMVLACSIPQIADLAPVFARQTPKYRNGDNRYLKYPVGSDFADPLVINEYEAYLYHGVVACHLWESRNGNLALKNGVDWHNLTTETLPARDPLVATPFVSPSQHSHDSSKVYTNAIAPSRYLLKQVGRADILFDEDELPIATHPFGADEAVFLRRIGDNALFLELRGPDGLRVERTMIGNGQDGAKPIFRASLVHAERIYFVYYDNVVQTNFISVFEHKSEGLRVVGKATPLPSFEDPAGGTYEMIPAVFLTSHESGVSIVAGTLSATLLHAGKLTYERIPDCIRAVEAVGTERGPVVLCLRKTKDAGGIYRIHGNRRLRLPAIEPDGIPFGLSYRDGAISLDYAREAADFARLFVFDVSRAQQNGWMEFGIGNEEGRIPWSQIYYLNGLIDLLLLTENDARMHAAFSGMTQEIRTRLDLEMRLLDRHWRDGLYKTRAFTVDRSPALFAVQTSRLLLLMGRYLTEVRGATLSNGFEELRRAVHCLKGHIEILDRGGEPERWMARGAAHLRWPKGSRFSFDGLAVPFNHQNEWAYAVLRTGSVEDCPDARKAATEILQHFVTRIAPLGVLPNNGIWDYWWGIAYDGWTEAGGISVNRPFYPGDKIKAWISFRTIDAMSLLAGADYLPFPTSGNILASVRFLTETGLLYPFASVELARRGEIPKLNRRVAAEYARIGSPWDIQSAVWAYRSFLVR